MYIIVNYTQLIIGYIHKYHALKKLHFRPLWVQIKLLQVFIINRRAVRNELQKLQFFSVNIVHLVYVYFTYNHSKHSYVINKKSFFKNTVLMNLHYIKDLY